MPAPAPCPTSVSGFITQLQDFLARYGDMPIAAVGHEWLSASVHVYRQECYYDGGCVLPLEDTPYHCRHWVRSRTLRTYPYFACIGADEPLNDDGLDTLDGAVIPVPPEKEPE